MSYQEKDTFKKALWQYCIDHSKLQPNGYYGILFYVKDYSDLERRIKGRIAGFSRYNISEKETSSAALKAKWEKIESFYHACRKWEKKVLRIKAEIKQGRNITKKIALYCYIKLKKYLFYENT